MPQEEGDWASLFSLPMVLRRWDQVWATIFTVSQPLAQVLPELPDSNQPLSCSQHEWISGTLFHSATQSLVQGSSLPLGVQHETSQARSSTWPLSLWEHTAQIILGASQLAAQEFLTKQLPPVIKKHKAFHTAQLSNQSRDSLSQGPM